MKKIIIGLLLLSILTGCKKKLDEPIINDNPVKDTKEEIYVDDNPITVGLYNGYNLVKNYSTDKTNLKDLGVFSVYYTNKEKLDSDYTKYNYQKFYKNYENISKYKNGFYISFTADNNKKIEQLVLNASSMHAMAPYLYVYLYDDVHQPDGAWYSHLEDKDFNDQTIISSIKLFQAEGFTRINSPITLTAITYDNDDFDENFRYRGKSSYTIKIDIK